MNCPKLPPSPELEFNAPDDVRVRGSRVLLEIVIEEHLQGKDPRQIQHEYPTLDIEAVSAVLAYYQRHREAVDRYVAFTLARDRELERAHDQLPDPPVVARLKALQALKKSA